MTRNGVMGMLLFVYQRVGSTNASWEHIDGSTLKKRNYSALVMELRLVCIKLLGPSGAYMRQ